MPDDSQPPPWPLGASYAALTGVLVRMLREDEQSSPEDRSTYSIRERLHNQVESFCESVLPRNPRIQLGLREIWRVIQVEADRDEPTI